jgi:clan AA aspartic protease
LIEGTVSIGGVPTISLEVAGKVYRSIVDTGFNGDLELPLELFDLLKPALVGEAKSLLAGGMVIFEDVNAVRIEFDGRNVEAEVTFVNSKEILIGTKLLSHHQLQIDFVSRKLLIERAT